MTVFLTPDGAPFYGGTYFPPVPRGGLPSFQQVLLSLADAYENRRDEVLQSAESVREYLQAATSATMPPTETEDAAILRQRRLLAALRSSTAGSAASARRPSSPRR